MSDQLARVVIQLNEFAPSNFGATARLRVGSINSGMAKNEDYHHGYWCHLMAKEPPLMNQLVDRSQGGWWARPIWHYWFSLRGAQ